MNSQVPLETAKDEIISESFAVLSCSKEGCKNPTTEYLNGLCTQHWEERNHEMER